MKQLCRDHPFILGCGIYFLLVLLFQLHGYSLSQWASVFNDPTMGAPMIGRPRGIRSDDWMAQIPVAISQTIHHPSFPEVNKIIHPWGHEMGLGLPAPTKDFVMFFKPVFWGYLVGPDFGISWQWNAKVLILLIGAYFFFFNFLGMSSSISALGSLMTLNSSFFSYWSYASEPIVGLGLLAGVLIIRQLRGLAKIWEWFGLVWCLLCFCFGFLYPPIQVAMVYFIVAALIGCTWKESWSKRGLISTVLALSVCIGIACFHLYQTREILFKVLNTIYPGRRISLGGDLGIGQFLMMTTMPLNGYLRFENLNICEAGSTYFVGLFAGLVMILSRRNHRYSAVEGFLIIFTVLLGIFCFCGMPKWLALVTGLSYVPAARVLALWTILNISWILLLVDKSSSKYFPPTKRLISVVVGCFAALAFWSANAYPMYTVSRVLVGTLLFAFVLGMVSCRPRAGAWVTLVIVFCGSFWFNPIDKNRYQAIKDSKTVKAFIQKFNDSGKSSVLLLDGDVRTANFLRMLGIPSYGGMQFIPPINFWKTLSLDASDEKFYNRFAHVAFKRAEKGAMTSFENPANDVLVVTLSESDIEKLARSSLVLDKIN